MKLFLKIRANLEISVQWLIFNLKLKKLVNTGLMWYFLIVYLQDIATSCKVLLSSVTVICLKLQGFKVPDLKVRGWIPKRLMFHRCRLYPLYVHMCEYKNADALKHSFATVCERYSSRCSASHQRVPGTV